MMHKLLPLVLIVSLFTACVEDQPTSKKIVQKPEKVVDVPVFNGDSAYQYVADQVAFGPRVPNTLPHSECAVYLQEKLASFGAEVIVQEAVVSAFDGTPLNMKNIIGQFAPEKKKRVLLYAHWDTRPFADKDSVRVSEPIDGANDGGSGVGVLLEVARIIQSQPTDVGIDIIFFDTEDYGTPEWDDSGAYTDWCLGSQYWAANKHKPGYRAKYGILLDMVGAENAIFNKEGTSMALSPNVVNKVWKAAHKLGHTDLFRETVTPQTIDDNFFVTQGAGIPSANIVHYHVNVLPMGYGSFHHTHQDNMDIISKDVLGKVGQTVLEVIYQE
ncbi:MAG: M28 family peptidase [Flavobacteriales bacterium]|nr:M28 family peptidase [Flavobacteriales bacterium]MDG1781219.1 M28 family peptidase [Flavobacteriales bacterium]